MVATASGSILLGTKGQLSYNACTASLTLPKGAPFLGITSLTHPLGDSGPAEEENKSWMARGQQEVSLQASVLLFYEAHREKDREKKKEGKRSIDRAIE